MLDFEKLLNALQDEVAEVPCPACHGSFKAAVGELRDGTVLKCQGCGFEVPMQTAQTPEDLVADVKKDLAGAFKRAFKAIEEYAEPPEVRAWRKAQKQAVTEEGIS